MFKKIKKEDTYKLTAPEIGFYQIILEASVKSGIRGRHDLKVELDGRQLREIPTDKNVQHYNIPPAWNGTKLKGMRKIVILVTKLTKGDHWLKFIANETAILEKKPELKKIAKPNQAFKVVENLKTEERNRQPWVSIALLDLPLNFMDVSVTCKKRFLDSDDLKLVIDGKIQKNEKAKIWGRNWFWQGRQLKGQTETKRFNLNLPQGIHYLEFWADRTPVLNEVNLGLGGIEGKSLENEGPKNDNEITKDLDWWRKFKAIQKYSFKGVSGKEDYNRYDDVIRDKVAFWNFEFSKDSEAPENPLDPNLVKAIIYQESRVGYYNNGTTNVMQVGNEGDPSLETLNGKLTEWWIHNGKQLKLNYQGEAKNDTVENSIHWGVRWLYHKAQYIGEDEKRKWVSWEEAVHEYGPGTEEYSKNVMSIYEKGITRDKSSNKNIKLWSIIIFCLISILSIFAKAEGAGYSTTNTTDDFNKINELKKNISLKEKDWLWHQIYNMEFDFSKKDPSLFIANLETSKDWFGEIQIGRWENNQLEWLPIISPPVEQSIYEFCFVDIKGIVSPVVEVYGSTHIGNGNLYLYEIEDKQVKLILEVSAVDSYYDSIYQPDNLERFGYSYCGEIFRNKKLKSDYQDLNNDNIAEVILSGWLDFYCEDIEKKNYEKIKNYKQDELIKISEREIKLIFQWNEEAGMFEGRSVDFL